MRIIGCDLHAAQQTIAMLDGDTGEVVERTLTHEGEAVRAVLRVDSGAGGRGHRSDWFHGVVSPAAGGIGHPVPSGASRSRAEGGDTRQKHDRRDADLLLKLLVEDRFPAIWIPSTEQRDLGRCSSTGISGCACARGCSRRSRPSHGSRPPSRGDVVEPERPGDARGDAIAAACGASPQ